MEISKNKEAEELVGLRRKGNSIFLPYELGYACPICGVSDEVNLDFSEYNGFLYCHKCNLDIPSCLCVKYCEPKLSNKLLPKRDKIAKATKIYLNCIGCASESPYPNKSSGYGLLGDDVKKGR